MVKDRSGERSHGEVRKSEVVKRIEERCGVRWEDLKRETKIGDEYLEKLETKIVG